MHDNVLTNGTQETPLHWTYVMIQQTRSHNLEGSRRFRNVQEGSRECSRECSRRFKKVQEGSRMFKRMFKKVQEGSRRFKNVQSMWEWSFFAIYPNINATASITGTVRDVRNGVDHNSLSDDIHAVRLVIVLFVWLSVGALLCGNLRHLSPTFWISRVSTNLRPCAQWTSKFYNFEPCHCFRLSE